MADNTLTLKIDNETALPLLEKMGKDIIMPIVEGAGKSAYAIAVSHGYTGTESEWLESLRGPKGDPGDKGDPFKFSDFTLEQLNALKGKKGDKGDAGSADNTYNKLLAANVYVENSSIDTVLSKIVDLALGASEAYYKPLTFVQPAAGATYIDFTGQPHFKLSINGGEKLEFISNNMRVPIDSTMKGTITVGYYGLVDNLKSTQQITLITQSETYNSNNGLSYTKDDRIVTIDASNYNGNSELVLLPKWSKSEVDEVKITTDKKVILQISSKTFIDSAGLSIDVSKKFVIVNQKELIIFKVIEELGSMITLTTQEDWSSSCLMNTSMPYIFYYDGRGEFIINSEDHI